MTAARAGPLAALVLIAAGAGILPAIAAGNDDCLACHSDASLTMERRGRTIPLHVDAAALAATPHKDAACTDCHAGFKADELPHKPKITPVNCMDCHGGAPSTHIFHSAMARATGTDGDPGTSCKECHGTHDVRHADGPESKFAPARLPDACGGCHGGIAAMFRASEHGRALAEGEPGAPDCLACHREPLTPARGAASAAELKQIQERACVACHVDNPEVRARMGPDARFIASYESSVHGRALLSGNAAAPTCIDCHGSHEMRRGNDPQARVSRLRTPETCAACHAGIAAQYAGSVHGAALARGGTEAPMCTDCHGEHTILKHTDPRAPVAAANVSQQVCSPCHSSVRLSQKYGIASDRFQTFADSYHGLAVRGGAVETANCASCHGSHDIRPSSDPASSIHKDNLAGTCGACHPGANERFATGDVHVVATAAGEPALYWIAAVYIALIVVTIGGMFAHNLLDFLRKSSIRLRERRHGGGPVHHGGGRLHLRMSLNERLQHGLLVASFTVLAITGFMLSYPEAWWVRGIRGVVPGLFETRTLLHRVAAVVMTAASLYHAGYLAFTARGRRLVRDLLPILGDVRQMLGNLAWLAWLSRARPRFGRFNYIEKVEYWALVWGTFVMAGTGLVMWFENTSMPIITKLGWDIARTIHFYEAWLATLAILVWHIYFVVLNPDVYPMNLAWLTGRLSESEMAEEHPAELEALEEQEREQETPSDRQAS